MRHLGNGVCPRVYDIQHDSYVMEHLQPYERTPGTAINVANLLRDSVWHREPWDEHRGADDHWTRQLEAYLGLPFGVPTWAIDGKRTLIHGDPTMANVMYRARTETMVLIDPKPPGGYCPSYWEVDAGKIVQSLCGWETMIAGDEPIDYDLPDFFYRPKEDLRRVLWWAGIHTLRIIKREERQEARPEIMVWAKLVHDRMHTAADT